LFEKSEIIQDHRTRVSGVLGQKLGYDNWQPQVQIKEPPCVTPVLNYFIYLII